MNRKITSTNLQIPNNTQAQISKHQTRCLEFGYWKLFVRALFNSISAKALGENGEPNGSPTRFIIDLGLELDIWNFTFYI